MRSNRLLRTAWVEIDCGRLRENIRAVKAAAGPANVIAVLKADAYGHGAVRTAGIAAEEGINTIAVATLEEALELAEAGVDARIVILGATPAEFADLLVRYGILPTISSLTEARELNTVACEWNKTAVVCIKLDTGMTRLGFEPTEQSINEIVEISKMPGLKIHMIYSHFFSAEKEDKTEARLQLEKFRRFCDELEARGVDLPVKSISNSAATLEMPEARFDAVRAGLILYGYLPEGKADPLQRLRRLGSPLGGSCRACATERVLLPAMQVKARISELHRIAPGVGVGYDSKFIAKRPSVIATLPLGYADGLSRKLSCSVWKVKIHGFEAPIVGNICMDQCMVDVTDVPGVMVGDEVIVMDDADAMAEVIGTISYEVLTGFNLRLPKVYEEG